MKTLIIITLLALSQISLAANKADHLVKLNWNDKAYDVENVTDYQIVKIVLPASSKKLSVKQVDESQMLSPCEVLKVEQTAKQSVVVIQLGETNSDEGSNTCTFKISGTKSILVSLGYYIGE